MERRNGNPCSWWLQCGTGVRDRRGDGYPCEGSAMKKYGIEGGFAPLGEAD